ncbi:putative long-chain-alcohol O-fatty-acyltransferase 4 [Raphanus sativus]|nr:putative long-chain-alcohol O-fatty-acyltransferase 4 [Raphanus sativus]
MEEELKSFMKVWVSAIMSITYCYYFSTRIKAGVFRLLSVLPVCVLFLFLPLFFSSVHFTGFTAFSLTWLATFKLILFSFDEVHEFVFFYFTRERPTGEVTWFFVLHGVCAAGEGALKRTSLVPRWKMNLMVSRLFTVGFVVVTGGWLFFPPLTRSGMFSRLSNEVLSSSDFVKHTFCRTFGGFAKIFDSYLSINY